ncbi:MAG: hypothetical protein PVH62_07275 [Anaerolineae bacterium]|jgi:hypothetical protein
MSSLRRASVLELARSAYEIDAGVIQGRLHRSEKGRWMIDETLLEEWLEQFDDQEVCLIVGSLEDDRPLRERVCRTCGTKFAGPECPRCRTARIRLRGG